MPEAKPKGLTSQELPFANLVEGIEEFSKEALDFGNKFFSSEVQSGNISDILVANSYRPASVSVSDDIDVFFQYGSDTVFLNPKIAFLHIDKFLDKKDINLDTVQVLISLIIFHELGHHLLYMSYNSRRAHINLSFSEDCSDYFAGYVLYNYMRSKGLSLSEAKIAFEIFQSLLEDFEKGIIEFQASKVPNILRNPIGEHTSIRGHNMPHKRIELCMQGFIDAHNKVNPREYLLSRLSVTYGKNLESLTDEEVQLLSTVRDVFNNKENKHKDWGFVSVHSIIERFLDDDQEDDGNILEMQRKIKEIEEKIMILVKKGYLRRELNNIYI